MNVSTKHRLVGACTLVLLLVGCDKEDSSLGDLPESTSASTSGSESDSETGAVSTTSGSESDSETGAVSPTESTGVDTVPTQEDSNIGAPCELRSTPETYVVEPIANESCGEGYCLYADPVVAGFDESCEEDGDCEGVELGIVCDPQSNRCVLDPAHVAERSMCTGVCEQDSDCVGVDGTACEGGFTCGPVASLGSLCCQKLCICNDDYDVTYAELENECAQGLPQQCQG